MSPRSPNFLSRRNFLASAAALGASLSVATGPLIASAPAELVPRTTKRRAVIVGGGWGGLSAARHLRDLAPELEVVLLERNPNFWSCPLSTRWLIGQIP